MKTSPCEKFRSMILLVVCAVLIGACASSQQTSKKNQSEDLSKEQPKSDNGMEPYSKVITDEAETDKGLFDIHKIDKDYFYEIPDSLLSRQMLLVSRLAETQDELTWGGGGVKLNTQVIRWQKKQDNILLRHVSNENVAPDSLPVYEAVGNSNFEPIIASFPIKSLGEDSSGTVINVTKLYASDIPSMGLQPYQREQFQVRRLDSDRSYIEHIYSYPENIEARNWMTWQASNPPSASTTQTISVEINHSMVLLPEEPIESRSYDPRVGYFSIEQTDFGSDAHKAKTKQYVNRYQLIPKDKQAYLDGELVEPVDPIVYYVGPGTPQKWRPYLKAGVEEWQEAFESAGFKNAIIAKDPPSEEENPDWSPEDVRYSVIRYFASETPNAVGPHVHDPRSGQILESDIWWYHNIMNLLRNWYFVQTAAANPKAQDVEFSDETMGKLMKFVATHEVGHTLGLAHNFGSSYAYPVDSLRSPSFTSTHGTAPSIMDYARFNYVAQPGDGVEDFSPAIGAYDKWAIKWGYTWFPDHMSKKEKEAKLNKWTRQRADDPVYFFGDGSDPRSQSEDLGNSAVKASEYGIANLKRITNNLVEWTERPGATYEELEELYQQITWQWQRYMGHVISNIGGVYETDKTYDQEGVVYKPVPEKKQKKAMNFLIEQAFETPTWITNSSILDRTNHSSTVHDMRSLQARVLNDVLDPERIVRLIEIRTRYNGDAYGVLEMMNDLRKGIWSELDKAQKIGVYRRMLQRAYLERMDYLLTEEITNPDISQSDIRPIVVDQLQQLQDKVRRSQNRVTDDATVMHLQNIERRIDRILNPNG